MQAPCQDDLYLYIDNKMLQTTQLVGDIYFKFKDRDDGFLYLSYSDKRPFDVYLDFLNKTNLILISLIFIILYYIFF